jgi:hypothetical protein
VLGLAAVAMNAARGTALAGDGALKPQWLLLGLGVIVLALVLVVRVQRVQAAEDGRAAVESRVSSLVVPGFALMALATFVGLTILGTRGAHFTPPPPPEPYQPSGRAAGTSTPGDQVDPVQASPRHNASINFTTLLDVFLILLGVVAVVLVVLLLMRWLKARQVAEDGVVDGGPAGDGTEEALAGAVQAGREALADDPDPRTAIIACYAAMERSLADGGLSRLKADTPSELLRRAADAGLVQGIAAQTLTDLFSEARYSTHPMGEHQRDQARAALESISTHLAAATATADAPLDGREEIEI